MEWSKLKWLLIILFFALNVFLAINIYVLNQRQYEIDEDIKQDVVLILQENNVRLDKKLIGEKRVLLTGKLIDIGEDEEPINKIYLQQTMENKISKFENKESILNVIKKIISEHIKNETKFIVHDVSYDQENFCWTILYDQYTDEYKIADASLKVVVKRGEKGDEITISGDCVCGYLYEYKQKTLCDPLNALLNFPSVITAKSIDEMASIEKINLMYMVSKKDTLDVLLPVWVICWENQAVYFDASSGDFIKVTGT